MTQQQQALTLCQDVVASSTVGGGPASGSCAKDFRERTLRSLKLSLGKLWRRRSVTITEYDPTYKVAYLGNVLTGWAKGEGCVEKPLSTLWKNYTGSSKPDVQMKVTVTQAGLKAVTKEHGLTEYWSHRITYCAAPSSFPRIFCWVYRHEGRKLKQELRCHAVLCSKEAVARRMASQLRAKLAQSLSEFKRDKVCRQNARLSLANSVYDNPSLPRRKILLSTGTHNYRPPLERSKSAPKLMVIEESLEEGEEECSSPTTTTSRPRLLTETRVSNRLDGERGGDSSTKRYPGMDSWRCRDTLTAVTRNRSISEGSDVDSMYSAQNNSATISRLAPPTSEEDPVEIPDDTNSRITNPDERNESDSVLTRLRPLAGQIKRRVGWKNDLTSQAEANSFSWNRMGSYQTERLLVIGGCKDRDVRRGPRSETTTTDVEFQRSEEVLEIAETIAVDSESGGDDSLQSYSSSGSDATTITATSCTSRGTTLEAASQDEESGNEVDPHPTGDGLQLYQCRRASGPDLERLTAQLRRSATFPPPVSCTNAGGEISELDSLSEEDDVVTADNEEPGEEDNVSDESGYAELMDPGNGTAPEDQQASRKEYRVHHNHLHHHNHLKSIIPRSAGNSAPCLQV